MQHDNFRNLNRVVSTQSKHLESRVNAFWYCFQKLNDVPFTIDEIGSYFRKSDSKVVVRRCSAKKLFLEISQNS